MDEKQSVISNEKGVLFIREKNGKAAATHGTEKERRMSELRNCEFCGRDTKNKSGACRHCMRGVSQHTKHEREHELSEGEKDMFREVNGVSRETQILRDVYRSILDELE